MGIIRLLLAITVLTWHTESILGLTFVGFINAVKVFYIMSGFYMALVINEKYSKTTHPYRYYISNRLLRIFPIYWITLLLTFILISRTWLNTIFSYNVSISTFLLIILINIFILGTDLVAWFMGIDKTTGNAYFFNDMSKTRTTFREFNIVPQAWTVSMELIFYFLAPSIVKMKFKTLLLLIFASLVLRFYLYSLGFNGIKWIYGFFPTELIFFLFGIISYKLYRVFQKIKLEKTHLNILYLLILFYITLYQFLPLSTLIKSWFLYLLIMFTIPFIFIFTSKNRIDRFLGDFSYPVFITHVFVLLLITQYFIIPERLKGIVTLIVTTIFSALLLKFIGYPLDKFRQRRIDFYKKRGN